MMKHKNSSHGSRSPNIASLADLRYKMEHDNGRNCKTYTTSETRDEFTPEVKKEYVWGQYPRTTTRPGVRVIQAMAVRTDQKAKPYYRWNSDKYREVTQNHCHVGEIESMVSDGATTISTTDYEKYRRNGPRIRMPYRLAAKNEKPSDSDVEPERYDTMVRMENEYYRRSHKLARQLWRVTRPVHKRALIKKPQHCDEVCRTQAQGPLRRTKQVEIDRSQIQHHPDASDSQRMQHLMTALGKLRIKEIRNTNVIEQRAAPKMKSCSGKKMKCKGC